MSMAVKGFRRGQESAKQERHVFTCISSTAWKGVALVRGARVPLIVNGTPKASNKRLSGPRGLPLRFGVV